MPQQRRSKFIRPPVQERTSFRPERRDLEYLRLFGPDHRFDYLWAHDMALLLGRNFRAAESRIRTLWEWEYFNRWVPQRDFVGGSEKFVYFPAARAQKALEKMYNQPVTIKELDIKKPHPFAKHSVLVNHVRAVITRAIENYKGMEKLYYLRDREFQYRFKANKSVKRKNKIVSYKVNYSLIPDGVFGTQLKQLAASNFFIEVLRSNQEIKEPKNPVRKSIRKKYEAKYYAFLNQEWRKWTKKYPQIINPKNTRVLTFCDMQEQEFENLLTLVRNIDHQGKGLRTFYFVRFEDFEKAISVVTKVTLRSGKTLSQRSYTDDSIMRFFDPIFYTARKNDQLQSILS